MSPHGLWAEAGVRFGMADLHLWMSTKICLHACSLRSRDMLDKETATAQFMAHTSKDRVQKRNGIHSIQEAPIQSPLRHCNDAVATLCSMDNLGCSPLALRELPKSRLQH